MNGRDFLVLARTWAGSATEAAWRSSTSRAYYAAFHVARDMLDGLGFTVPPSEKAHAYLLDQVDRIAASVHGACRLGFARLRRRDRGFADYQLQHLYITKRA